MVDDVPRVVGRPLLVEPGVIEGEPRAFTLPTGTVTFLLTDVEGSTQRWESAPTAMATAIARHHELLEQVIERHGGVRPVEQGEGDSVVAAFSRASDAVAAALAAQLALVAEPWPEGAELSVRMAVHTGEVQLRGEYNYVGQALNRCARLRGIGHGGQVLVSAAAAAVVVDRLPDGVTLRDLGLHRLRDLGRPEHVWQLVHPDLRAAFGLLRSLDAYRHNLPIQLTSLVGRVGEIAELRVLFSEERLVTLVGSAGVGKTRLALAVSADLLERYRGGVWWVELAALSDQDAVGRAALAALGAQQHAGLPMAAQLAVELGDVPSLVVLDNCEHLIAPCAGFVADLLSAGAAVSVLATSREPLGVPGEVVWRVPSLRCPRPEQAVSVPALSQYDAVKLFVDRAHRARPSFKVDDHNAPAVAQICHRLDGIPLAIELAAARCRQTSAERIAADLDDRFRYLTGGARTVMARQQTLAASVDWSYENLEEREQIAFRRLGVFVGPFPLEAAEMVVASPGDVDRDEVFDLTTRLVDKSLVVAEEDTDAQPRYRLLETLRAYATVRAHGAGELTGLRDAHATWWSDWLEPRWSMPSDETVAAAEQFHGDLVAALEWSIGDSLRGLTLLARLGRIWTETGRGGDSMVVVDRLLIDDNAQRHGPLWLMAATHICVPLWMARGDAATSALLERVDEVAGEVGDDYHAALAGLGRFRTDRSDMELVRDVARERGDRYVEVEATVALACVAANDDPVAAAPLLAALSRTATTSRNRRSIEGARLATALAARSTGDLRTCIQLTTDVLNDGSAQAVNDAVNVIGVAALLARDEQALRLAVGRAESMQRKNSGLPMVADVARHRLDLLAGEASTVNSELAAGEAPWPMTSATLWVVGREAIDAGASDIALAGVRALADDAPHDQAVTAAVTAAVTGEEDAWHGALELSVEHDLRLIAVDALEGLAAAAARTESWAECLRLLAAGQRLRDELDYRWRFRFEQAAVDVARQLATDNLDDDEAERATTEGRSLHWQAAAAYARRARGERKRPRHGWASLTPTEQQVVALVSDGLTNAQIASQLLMGQTTVKTHLAHIFNKLGVSTRAQLAGEAARRAQQ
jgi:predicted ATPase/class 3 adenylate cyclase/DNA-binding CsgD family transcriptional regulator